MPYFYVRRSRRYRDEPNADAPAVAESGKTARRSFRVGMPPRRARARHGTAIVPSSFPSTRRVLVLRSTGILCPWLTRAATSPRALTTAVYPNAGIAIRSLSKRV